jgi:hypothetical protein
VVCNNTSRLLADKEAIEKLEGRVNFICQDKIEPFVDKKDLSKFAAVRVEAVDYEVSSGRTGPPFGKLGKSSSMYAHATAHCVHVWWVGLIDSGSSRLPALIQTRLGCAWALVNRGEPHSGQNSRVIVFPLSPVVV